MVDIKKLIQTILNGGKMDEAPKKDNPASSESAPSQAAPSAVIPSESVESVPKGNIYRDEPILKTAAQMKNLTPVKYREMKQIADRYPHYFGPDAEIFYKQGKFMEDFEDNFVYQHEFSSYFPTYRSMSTQELRGYFSWRTKVRHQIIEKTSLSFVYVYIYELLNQIGVPSPEKGYHILKAFQKSYEKLDPRINRYLNIWLKDYVVYYRLNPALLGASPENDYGRDIMLLIDYKQHDCEEIFNALNNLSSYHIENSRFYKQYSDDVKQVVYHVFSALSEDCEQRPGKNLCERLFGKIESHIYPMFRSAVFYDQMGSTDFVYKITSFYQFRRQGRAWYCDRFCLDASRNPKVGALLKSIDYIMRQRYDFPWPLKVTNLTKHLEEVIRREVEKELDKKRELSRPKVEIDISKLQDIRTAALETQSKLIVEEPEDFPAPPPALAVPPPEPDLANSPPADDSPDTDTPTVSNKIGLGDTEYEFLRLLLYQKPYREFVRSRGAMVSVLTDTVNEALYDTFGDTVLACDGDTPELIEDYMEELKGMIPE